jgi:DNA-binding NtrC family response regulator
MELHGIVGVSAPMQEVYDHILRFARSAVPLMVLGETGTGKEMVARAIRRIAGSGLPFVSVNCAAIPDALVESELFGHEKGAFTGATHRRDGLLAQADGGILFLDEVGELPPAAQAKLLRALETGEYRPVGAPREARARFRLVTATNRDLDEMVTSQRFRADLLHRLGTARITLPPLRERPGDVPLLAGHFLDGVGAHGPVPAGISEAALAVCSASSWPGNVRQLRHALEAAAAHAGEGMLRPEHLVGLVPVATPQERPVLPLKQVLRERERQAIDEALASTRSNREAAAALLGISLATLYRRMAVLQIPL